jgi:hypothetical protein
MLININSFHIIHQYKTQHVNKLELHKYLSKILSINHLIFHKYIIKTHEFQIISMLIQLNKKYY